MNIDVDQLLPSLLQSTGHQIGEKFLQSMVEELAQALGAKIVFVTRAQDYPTTRVQMLASSQQVLHEFSLRGTPCLLVYDGQPVSIPEGVARTFEGEKDSGFESFVGLPLFNENKLCIGHLGLYFAAPTVIPERLMHLLQALALRMEAELQRLELETRLESARRQLYFQNHVLQMAAAHQPLEAVFEYLIRGIESEHPDMRCSLMMPNARKTHLRLIAAPSLPPSYRDLINGVEIRLGSYACAAAACSGERVLVEDMAQHPCGDVITSLAATEGLGSCWAQPLIDGAGQVQGVFSIFQRYPGLPSEAHLALIESVTDLSCLVLGHYQVLERLHLKTQKYQLFLRTAPDGVVVIDLDGLLVEVSDGFLRQMGVDSRETWNALNKTHVWDWDAIHDEAACRTLLAQMSETPVTFETRKRRLDGTLWYAEITASAFLINGQTLVWASSRDITERKRLEAELQRRATTDNLTGLMNRGAFMGIFEPEFQRAQRHARPFSVLMLDIDHFKLFNDRHGHHAGDEVLRQIAKTCQATLRAEDVVCRLGGEEFAFLLPETDVTGAWEVAEKIRLAIGALSIVYAQGEGPVAVLQPRCSVGVATLVGCERNHEELLSRADQALYQAKAAGRNQVVVSAGPP
jgi:diguanylate cyclase (GGDEF)-like protein/PAS domain S-box-containing protein